MLSCYTFFNHSECAHTKRSFYSKFQSFRKRKNDAKFKCTLITCSLLIVNNKIFSSKAIENACRCLSARNIFAEFFPNKPQTLLASSFLLVKCMEKLFVQIRMNKECPNYFCSHALLIFLLQEFTELFLVLQGL